MTKIITIANKYKLGMLILGLLLLAGIGWWCLCQPKTFTLMSSYLPEAQTSIAIFDYNFCPAGLLIVHIADPHPTRWGVTIAENRVYTLLDWYGKQRWQITSHRFAEYARVQLQNWIIKRNPKTGVVTRLPANNPDDNKYAILHALSPDRPYPG